MKKLLKLQDHRHTAKHLQHHHTSYRGIAVILVLTFGVIFGMQHFALADSYMVTATVPAIQPTVASEVLNPVADSSTTDSVITVSGSCQILVPSTIVAVYIDGTLVGSTGCKPTGSYSMQVTLNPGKNQIIVKTASITQQQGPDGTPVTVTYLAPIPEPAVVPVENNVVAPPQEELKELSIKQDSLFLQYAPGTPIEWALTLSGGKLPYSFKVNWGDGTVDVGTAETEGIQKISHTYSERKVYTVTFELTDAAKQTAIANIAAVSGGVVAGEIASALPAEVYRSAAVALTPTQAAYAASTAVAVATAGVWVAAASAAQASVATSSSSSFLAALARLFRRW